MKYENPSMEMIVIESEDIITLSVSEIGGSGNNGEVSGNWSDFF